MAIWLTSDTHLSHIKVSQLRGFDTVAEHDAAIMHNLSKIPATDVLWHLGDVAMGGWKDTIIQFQALLCKVHVVLGNHDRPSPTMSNSSAHMAEFMRLGEFESAQTMAAISYGGEEFFLSHYPYTGDHGEERFTKFRLRDEGTTLIHGHTHSSEKVSYTDKGTKQLHCGLDAWGLKPVRLGDLVQVI